ncbi:ribonuclease [Tsuneonella sp. YG55]|uniref:Ribonuclease n=1 Tax=Tsuneonella litorea TaxID=2976475 RepID=A0A9X3AA89_9SPHN|nr:ribonuclease [Tsuneonella litorea]MCT2559650.1 ribonuclease [Tsuneonella litorea]
MAEWLVERGIGEDRALLVENDRVVAAEVRWPGELRAGDTVGATLVQRPAGSPRGLAMTDDGAAILVDRLPRAASEGAAIRVEITRAAMAERGRLKQAQGRWTDREPAAREGDAFETGRPVRRFPPGLWEELWGAAWEGEVPFPNGALLFAITPGMTVIDIDGTLPPRELALAAVPSIGRALRHFALGGSIGIDFPTLAAKADRQAVDSALADVLDGWPHERTAMNGFGFVQLVARSTGPSLLHRLAHHRAAAAARLLLRRGEGTEGAGAIRLTAHSAVLAALRPEWLAELSRRTGREVRLEADHSLALDGGHAQIVPR